MHRQAGGQVLSLSPTWIQAVALCVLRTTLLSGQMHVTMVVMASDPPVGTVVIQCKLTTDTHTNQSGRPAPWELCRDFYDQQR